MAEKKLGGKHFTLNSMQNLVRDSLIQSLTYDYIFNDYEIVRRVYCKFFNF